MNLFDVSYKTNIVSAFAQDNPPQHIRLNHLQIRYFETPLLIHPTLETLVVRYALRFGKPRRFSARHLGEQKFW